jgi:hypothetical protein
VGIFNSVYVQCPHCSEYEEEQYKPGSMASWRFGVDTDIPLEYLRDFQNRDWTCWNCNKNFTTKVSIKLEIGDMIIEKAADSTDEYS